MQYFIILTFLSFFPTVAMAQNVSSGSIDKGVWEFNNTATFAQNNDDEDVFEQKTRVQYGVTDRFAVTYAAEFEQVEGNSIEFENSEVRAIYRLSGDNTPLNAVVRGIYDIDHVGDSDSVGLELLLGQRFGKWRHLLNIDTAHDVGEKSESGVELDLAWGTYYSFDKFRIGGEYYVDFGRIKDHQRYSKQGHQIGPSIKFDATDKLALEFAYFAGISRGADDHVFKNEIEFEF